MALASRIADNEVILIDELKFDVPRTREAAAIFGKLGLKGMRLLVALDGYDPVTYKSLRNIDRVETMPVSDINAYEILRPKRILMTRAALDMFRTKVAAVTA